MRKRYSLRSLMLAVAALAVAIRLLQISIPWTYANWPNPYDSAEQRAINTLRGK